VRGAADGRNRNSAEMPGSDRLRRSGRSFLDTVWARVIAGLVALAAAGALVALNRDALFGSGAHEPIADCLNEQLGLVEKLVSEGKVQPGQVDEMRIRARQLCAQAPVPGG
jgi:hypothetical protein